MSNVHSYRAKTSIFRAAGTAEHEAHAAKDKNS